MGIRRGKTLFHIGNNNSEIREIELSLIESKDKLIEIETCYSMVSSGTELLVAKGEVPKPMHQFMTVPYMQGDFNFPISYGYSLVGKVLSKNSDLFNKIVHLLHPHQESCIVKPSDCFLVPDNIPAQRAILASNMETAVNAVWDSKVALGDKVLIIGLGSIGALIASILNEFPGIYLNVFDLDSKKTDFAKKQSWEVVSRNKLRSDYDICFNCSGTESGLQLAVDSIAPNSKVIELSWFGSRPVSLNLGGDFHVGRKQIIASQVSQIPPNKIAKWDYKKRKELVFQLLNNPAYDSFITETIPFEKSPDWFKKQLINRTGSIGTCFSYH